MAAAVLLACAFPSAAGAQVTVVNNATDHAPNGCTVADCTLREAITQDTAPEVQVPEGTYNVTNTDILIARDVTIRGTGAGLATIQRVGEVPHRIFEIGSDSEVTISHVRISNGAEPNDDGGGILINSAGALVISDSEISGNFADVGGGIWTNGELRVRNSLIVSNRAETGTAGGWGGGIGVGPGNGEPVSLVNTTLSDNHTDGLGGGLFTQRSMSLVNVSIVDNDAPPPVSTQNGAGLYQQFPAGSGRKITALNTLVAFNVNGGCGGTANFLLDSTNSLLDELDRQPGPSCAVLVPGANILVNAGDAKVAPTLADNGGLTRTHALLPGSLAIDGGESCPADDQRAFVRPFGSACDIGAVEFGAGPPSSPPSGGGGTTQPPPDDDDELPDPEPGESVNALPARGTVKIRVPGTSRFVELEEGQPIPVGTVVDTLKGRVTLIAAGGQQATFYDGIFRIGQGEGAKPLTTLTLVEKLSCPKAGKAVAAAKKKKRRLWGDGSGKFRTKGKHSAATVVGTRWLVEDRCTSTTTRVTRGRVSVRDFVKKKTVTVRAGKKYVARAKKP